MREIILTRLGLISSLRVLPTDRTIVGMALFAFEDADDTLGKLMMKGPKCLLLGSNCNKGKELAMWPKGSYLVS